MNPTSTFVSSLSHQFIRVSSAFVTVVGLRVLSRIPPPDDFDQLWRRRTNRYLVSSLGLAYSDHRQFHTLMLPASVLALPPSEPVASLSCFHLATVVSEMETQTQRLRSASQMMAPTELYSFQNSPPPAHSECVLPVVQYLLIELECTSVTSVGGTNYIPETAVFFSGGGFSNYVRSSLRRLLPLF